MYADGCVLSKRQYGEQEFKIQIKKDDEEIIQHFKQDLKSTYPIRYDNTKINPQVIYCLRSQKTVDDLKKLGCIEQKSLILTFPTEKQVPSNLIYHFIRGYFDGDGSISKGKKDNYQLCFIGTESFIKTLSQYFEGGSVVKDKRQSNS